MKRRCILLATSTQIIISVSIGIVTFSLINTVFEVNFFKGISTFFIDILDTIVEHLGKYNTKRFITRIKHNRIVIQKENIYAKYNRLVEEMIFDFNLPLTLESFTSLVCICFAIISLIVITIMHNVALSVMITISVFTVLLTYFAIYKLTSNSYYKIISE